MNIPSIFSPIVVGLLIALIQTATASSEPFQPPAESSLPDNAFDETARQGQALFVETRKNASYPIGNQLNYVNCHLEQGRRTNSTPQQAAYPVYPAFRAKNNKVNAFVERLQGCFQFSMNGKVPAADDPEIKALIVYAYWLASQAPTRASLPGRGCPDVASSEGGYSIECSAKIYAAQCVICHGADGQGRMTLGRAVFPPLWGVQSLNWGADMHHINTVTSFIKHNMLLDEPDTLSDRDAWDVIAFMNSHEHLRDPRPVDDPVEKTQQRFHANGGVNLYGQKVNGVLLGQGI